MSKVRLGFVGVGGMGQCAHLRNYVINPECTVVALADLREDLARKVAGRYGVPRVYASHRQLLAGEREIDGIVAILPYHIHGRLLPELLAAEVPVLTEKPLARSVEVGEKIVAAQKQRGSTLFIGYNKRSDPATIFAKKQIERWKRSGEVGRMRYVRITMPPGDWQAAGFSHLIAGAEEYPQLDPDPPPAGMDEPAAERFDQFVNYYIHQVNLMRYLLGEEYRVCYADVSGVLLAGESRSGVTGVLEMAPYRTTIDWQETALVTFEKGWIRLELPAPIAVNRPGRVTIYRDPGQGETPGILVPDLPHVHSMRQQAVHFVQAVRGEATCLCQAEEALADLRLGREYLDLWVAAEAGAKGRRSRN